MSGKELFEKYSKAVAGTPGYEYKSILFTALLIVGEDQLYKTLEKAEKEGKRIELTYPIPIEAGPSEPDGIILV